MSEERDRGEEGRREGHSNLAQKLFGEPADAGSNRSSCRRWPAPAPSPSPAACAGVPAMQTQGPAGSRAPEHDLLRRPDFEMEDEDLPRRRYEGPDPDAPPDAVGPTPGLDADLTEKDLEDDETLQATESAQRAAGKGSREFRDQMEVAEARYEGEHPPSGGSSGSPPGTPRHVREVPPAVRQRVMDQLAKAFAGNMLLPTTGDAAAAAQAAAACEEQVRADSCLVPGSLDTPRARRSPASPTETARCAS